MTRREFALSAVTCAASAAFVAKASVAETAKERGKRLVAKVVEGLGGDAFRNMQTRTEVGRAYSFYREQLTGLSIARLYTKYLPPNARAGILELQRQAFGKKQEDAVLFTENEAYDVTYRGAKPLADDKVKQFRETTLHDVFYILRQRLSEPGIEFEGAGIDVVENQPVETLDIFDAENRSVRVWVNSDTYLPVKQRFYRWDPTINDRREEVTRYTKYRDSGNGVMWPYSVSRERDTEKNFEMYSERVTVGDALSDSMFELPNGIKILKP
ncbi:MAG TPA: hypothetical protein VHY84_02575 [Bryobacteraceae bacterium]|jgi:hypothetical protein|nr:hypothetical protein [Bryobacteraceae bacterium]